MKNRSAHESVTSGIGTALTVALSVSFTVTLNSEVVRKFTDTDMTTAEKIKLLRSATNAASISVQNGDGNRVAQNWANKWSNFSDWNKS